MSTARTHLRACPLSPHEITLKGAVGDPPVSNLDHALAPVAELPGLQVISAVHIVTDLPGVSEVVHDYLKS